MALEQPLARERAAGGETAVAGPLLLAGGLALLCAAWQGWLWWAARDWGHLAPLVAGLLALPLTAIALWRRAGARPVYDPALVREKLARRAFTAQLRLAVVAPPGTPAAAVEERL